VRRGRGPGCGPRVRERVDEGSEGGQLGLSGPFLAGRARVSNFVFFLKKINYIMNKYIFNYFQNHKKYSNNVYN
jgi:hypothetical protein